MKITKLTKTELVKRRKCDTHTNQNIYSGRGPNGKKIRTHNIIRQCRRDAVYKVSGPILGYWYLCKQHAGYAALDHLLEEEKENGKNDKEIRIQKESISNRT